MFRNLSIGIDGSIRAPSRRPIDETFLPTLFARGGCAICPAHEQNNAARPRRGLVCFRVGRSGGVRPSTAAAAGAHAASATRATAAAGGSATGDARGHPAGPRGRGGDRPLDGDLRLRHDRHGLRLQPDRSGLVRRRCGRPSCPSFENEFGADGQSFAGVRQTRFGVKAASPTPLRRAQDDRSSSSCSASASTPARRRSGCGTPTASSASSAPGRPGARSWTSTCSPTRSSTGARTAWSSSATSRCAGCRSRATPRLTFAARAAGRQRRRRQLRRSASSSQDVKARFPLPDLSGEFRLRRRLGLRRGCRGSFATSSGTTSAPTPFDLSGSAIGLGHQPELQRQARQERPQAAGRLRRGHRELHERRARRHRRREQPRQHRDARSRAWRCPSSASSRFIDLNWTEQFTSSVGYSLVDIDNSDGQAPSAFKRGQYALANLLCTPDEERDGRRRAPVGPARQLHDGFSVERLPLQFSFKYNFSLRAGRQIMT